MSVGTSNPVVALGRELVQHLLVALRSGQLYEAGNDTLEAAAERLARTVAELWQVDGWARLEVGEDTVLVNGTRIRIELRHYTVQRNLVRFLRSMEIGGFEWTRPPGVAESARFAHYVGRLEGEETGREALFEGFERAGVASVMPLAPRQEALEALTEDPDKRLQAERTYRHGVAVTREFMESVRSGHAIRRGEVKRAVQTIVDQVLEDDTLLVGLTNLRDYDEPTFTHSVNVCVFSVSLGQRIGLSRFELYDLGMAALLHDVGKVDVPTEVLQKAGALDDEEWTMMRNHVQYGTMRILRDRTGDTIPFREILVAFEHHLNIDLSGYPDLFAPRRLSFYSKIVSICDSFDAGTTPRVYKTDPISPPEMLQVLLGWKGVRYDPILLKAFIGLLGIYPAGSLVLLDTMELAVVVATSSDPELLGRPRARLITDPSGNRIEGPVVNLAERGPEGEHLRTIVKVLDPEKYGIDIGRYFLST